MADEKPSVLIIGGLGYIGRFLAQHIHQNNLASEVRLVDKVLPQLAWLAPEFSDACAQSKFVQADASRPGKQLPFIPLILLDYFIYPRITMADNACVALHRGSS